MCQELNVPYLGSLPVDPRLARCCDEGIDFLADMPDSPTVKKLQQIIERKCMWNNVTHVCSLLFFSEILQKCKT